MDGDAVGALMLVVGLVLIVFSFVFPCSLDAMSMEEREERQQYHQQPVVLHHVTNRGADAGDDDATTEKELVEQYKLDL